MTESFATELDLPAPIEEVFRHLTDPAAMTRWMGQHATLEPAVGGAFELDINGVPIRGRYLEIDPPRRVVVSWGVAGCTEVPPGAASSAIGVVCGNQHGVLPPVFARSVIGGAHQAVAALFTDQDGHATSTN